MSLKDDFFCDTYVLNLFTYTKNTKLPICMNLYYRLFGSWKEKEVAGFVVFSQ